MSTQYKLRYNTTTHIIFSRSRIRAFDHNGLVSCGYGHGKQTVARPFGLPAYSDMTLKESLELPTLANNKDGVNTMTRGSLNQCSIMRQKGHGTSQIDFPLIPSLKVLSTGGGFMIQKLPQNKRRRRGGTELSNPFIRHITIRERSSPPMD